MNRKLLPQYKLIMKNLLLICLLIFMSEAAQADIDASWNAKNQKAKINTIKRDGIRYISINELSKFLGSDHHVNIRRGIGSLELINGELNYTLFSPYVTVGEKGYNIEHDIIFYRGGFYAPLANIIPVIDRLIPDNLVYSAENNTINIFPAVYFRDKPSGFFNH